MKLSSSTPSRIRAANYETSPDIKDSKRRFSSNISYTRRRVSSDIQTPRSELKNQAIAEFFNQLQGVWISDETRLSSVYYISNKSLLKEKIGFKVVKILC